MWQRKKILPPTSGKKILRVSIRPGGEWVQAGGDDSGGVDFEKNIFKPGRGAGSGDYKYFG